MFKEFNFFVALLMIVQFIFFNNYSNATLCIIQERSKSGHAFQVSNCTYGPVSEFFSSKNDDDEIRCNLSMNRSLSTFKNDDAFNTAQNYELFQSNSSYSNESTSSMTNSAGSIYMANAVQTTANPALSNVLLERLVQSRLVNDAFFWFTLWDILDSNAPNVISLVESLTDTLFALGKTLSVPQAPLYTSMLITRKILNTRDYDSGEQSLIDVLFKDTSPFNVASIYGTDLVDIMNVLISRGYSDPAGILQSLVDRLDFDELSNAFNQSYDKAVQCHSNVEIIDANKFRSVGLLCYFTNAVHQRVQASVISQIDELLFECVHGSTLRTNLSNCDQVQTIQSIFEFSELDCHEDFMDIADCLFHFENNYI